MAIVSQFKLFFLFLLALNVNLLSQSTVFEICTNGIDDDQDGLIDIQDNDCFCLEWKTESLAPNPSFELTDCCPESASMMNCVTDWVQASLPTTDYFHACNYSGSDIFNLPQPIPDGEGFIGFIDGTFTGDFNPNWKEYIGACLAKPLEADSSYQLQFYIGFLDREVSPEINMAIFGTSDCNNLPFNDNDNSFGCPSNSAQWVRLGGIGTAGHNEWKQQEIIFKSLIDISAIVIGPDCNTRTATNNPYHFIDQVVLAKLTDFDVTISADNDLCAHDFKLRINALENVNYQWYKDGVAIANATQNSLSNPPGRGSYQVRIESELVCRLSTAYQYFPPFELVKLTATTCEGQPYTFGSQLLSDEGTYRDTFKMENNCDSIVLLNLQIEKPKVHDISIRIFPGEQFQIGSYSFDIPGNYTQTIPSTASCDSTIHLQLSNYSVYIPNAFSPNSDGSNDVFSVYSDTGLLGISTMTILDRYGNLLYVGKDLPSSEGWNGKVHEKPAAEGVYVYRVSVLMEDGIERSLSGTISLLR